MTEVSPGPNPDLNQKVSPPESSPISQIPETEYVHTLIVWCDGGGTSGHPQVYLRIGRDNSATCGYCDKRFVLFGETGTKSLGD